MDKRIKVAIVFGGRSPEHQISLLSAQNVYKSLDKKQFEPVLIGIDKNGHWHLNEGGLKLLYKDDPKKIQLEEVANPVLFSQNTNEGTLVSKTTFKSMGEVDVIFPVLHGTYGEDGSIQGLAKLANIPCVGCGILGSAVGMDKDMMKRILRDAGIPVAPGYTYRKGDENMAYETIVQEIGNELFIKPANLGSSVGVSFVKTQDEFEKAIKSAFDYDHKVLIEQKIIGREVECAVLGNLHPEASIPGEVVPKNNFYSFENKYIDEKGAELHIPADLNAAQVENIEKLALNTFKILECRGLARVDMFLTSEDQLFINEINTIPGFTNISMYPKLWEASGLDQQALITKLINLALEENATMNQLKMI